jgi:hypothetical protein
MEKSVHGRRDRLIKEARHDVYRERAKWPEPTLCTDCGAVFVNGRWTWEDAGKNSHTAVCPACRRVDDNLPAGHVEITGDFFDYHRREIINLIRNTESQEKQHHPLERIMHLEAGPSVTRITTTGIHLARRLGEALSKSYKGDLSVQYPDAELSVQVSWHRD